MRRRLSPNSNVSVQPHNQPIYRQRSQLTMAWMKDLETQNNFTKTRMITAHNDKLIAMPFRSSLMSLGESGPSGTHASTFSVSPAVGLEKSESSRTHALTFSVLGCIVIHPFSVVAVMTVFQRSSRGTLHGQYQGKREVEPSAMSERKKLYSTG